MPSGGVKLILLAQMSSFSDQTGKKPNNNTTLMEQFQNQIIQVFS